MAGKEGKEGPGRRPREGRGTGKAAPARAPGSGLAPHRPRVPPRPPPPLPRRYQAAQRLALRARGEGGRAPQHPRAEVRAAAQVEVPREAARGGREGARVRHRSRAVCPPCPAVPARTAQSPPRRGEGRPLGGVVPPSARKGRRNAMRTTKPTVHCERRGANKPSSMIGPHQNARDQTECKPYWRTARCTNPR